ncbi:MAG: C40 family peptidase [Oscillospiraceae bacterium]|nr:C40 family peptidase [Oscillospiraceae bacterium]
MKNKNNILIIVTVILAAFGVIAAVLITGFAHDGGSGESVTETSEPSLGEETPSSAESSEISEPQQEVSQMVGDSESSANNDDVRQRVVVSANALIGVPFAENGSSPSGFDNSGFVYYVLRENGYITCPRTTEAQSRMGARTDFSGLKPGDPVFFGNDGSGEADFGGIFIGNGKMIACLSPGTSVREVDITTDYYTVNFFGGISLT